MKKIVCPVFLALAFATAALGQNYTIQTFAGGGVPQNISALSASLAPLRASPRILPGTSTSLYQPIPPS
jgi:hypothetical protein